MMRLDGDITAETLEQLYGVRWPEPHDGERFVRCLEFQIEAQYQDVHWLKPTQPEPRVPTEWAHDEDGDEWPIAWRDMTNEEWSQALAEYEKALAHWNKTSGHERQKSGPDIVTGTFETAGGLKATGHYFEGAGWHWREMMW